MELGELIVNLLKHFFQVTTNIDTTELQNKLEELNIGD